MITISLKTGDVAVHDSKCEDWTVQLVDTGLNTQTGGRIKQLAHWIGHETFMMTYGDGLANINVKELVSFHKKHGKLATVTAVRPPARFGGILLDGNLVTEFVEKAQIGEGWVNGGFFVLERRVLDYVTSDETIFEHGPLERLAKEGQLAAYLHDGFWQCMDTLRDVHFLESLWEKESAPWKVW